MLLLFNNSPCRRPVQALEKAHGYIDTFFGLIPGCVLSLGPSFWLYINMDLPPDIL